MAKCFWKGLKGGEAFAASKPTKAQKKARSWLPEAMRFPAIDPDVPEALDAAA